MTYLISSTHSAVEIQVGKALDIIPTQKIPKKAIVVKKEVRKSGVIPNTVADV